METHFSTNALFRVVETDFLASANHKPFSCLMETHFLTNPLILVTGERFLSVLETVLESSFLLVETANDMCGNHFLKTALCLLVETIFFYYLRHFSRSSLSWLVETHFLVFFF